MRFCPQIFSQHKDHEDLFLVWPPKQVLVCISATVGLPFLKSNNVKRHFARIFQGFCSDFQGFCPDFQRFCSNFQGFCPDLWQIKILGVRFHHLHPRLLHHFRALLGNCKGVRLRRILTVICGAARNFVREGPVTWRSFDCSFRLYVSSDCSFRAWPLRPYSGCATDSSNALIDVRLVSVALSMCGFWKKVSYKKFHVAAFFAREIVDDCLQVRISKNFMLHATSLSLRFSSDFLVNTKCKAILYLL